MAGAQEEKRVFTHCQMIFITSRELSGPTITQLKLQVQSHGAEVLEPEKDGLPIQKATHIIANSIDFEEYKDASDMMVPVVMSDWIIASLHRNRQAQIRPYSPDPRMIFAGVTLTCADIPPSDKEAIAGAIIALGGTESQDLSRMTTHICALSMDNPKCQQAKEKGIKCKVVLPHWFDDCFRLGKRISESPYLLPDPEILRLGREDEVKIPSSQQLEGATSDRPDYAPLAAGQESAREKLIVFAQRKVMLSWDLSISNRLRKIIEELIMSGEGVVVDSVDACDMFICQYREGKQYIRASQMRKDVGSLSWLYHLITHNEWTSPLRRLLHYPVPKDGIPGFRDLRITLSNYGGEARIYLENLVIAAGATFTKTMRADNTHLITARGASDKFDAAQDWNIKTINHLWLEESYAKCEVQSETKLHYGHFPRRTNLGEVIGQTFFDETRLREMYYPGGDENTDRSAKRKRKSLEAAEESASGRSPAASALMGRHEHKEFDVMKDADIAESPGLEGSAPPRRTKSYTTPNRGRHVRTGKENDTPSILSTGSRSAKANALSKIQGLAPDIALYEKERKRSAKDGHGPWGGKRAADQFEKERDAAKSSSPAQGGPEEDDEPKQRTKRQKKSLPPIDMRVVLTGYTRWVGNMNKEDADRRKLRMLGIQLVQENAPCDVLAAPHVVRTTKFLCALARGPKVINSTFIDFCLDSGKRPKIDDFLLKDKASEEKFGVKLQTAVSRAKHHRGRLLWNTPVYCSAHIRHGTDSYKHIAEANGAIFKIYSARGGTTIKPTTAEEDGGAAPEPVYLLSSNTPKERELWPRFREMALNGNMEPRIVGADWLLDVAMMQQVMFDDKYYVENCYPEP